MTVQTPAVGRTRFDLDGGSLALPELESIEWGVFDLSDGAAATVPSLLDAINTRFLATSGSTITATRNTAKNKD